MDGKAGTFSEISNVVEGMDADGNGVDTDITGGTLTVKRDGANYEFSFNCTGKDGRAISGYYKGALPRILPPKD